MDADNGACRGESHLREARHPGVQGAEHATTRAKNQAMKQAAVDKYIFELVRRDHIPSMDANEHTVEGLQRLVAEVRAVVLARTKEPRRPGQGAR